MNKPSTRAEPGKRNTMNRLLAAGRKIFAMKGLAGARVEDIAREAKVTKQLVYHYYGSKEVLFLTVLDDASQQIMQELIALDIDDLPPEEALRSLLYCCFDQYMKDPHLGALALEGIRFHNASETRSNSFTSESPALVVKFSAVLKRGMETGVFRQGIDARLLLASSALLMSGGFTNHYTMSVLVGFDTTSEDGMRIWRAHSANLILASIMQQSVRL